MLKFDTKTKSAGFTLVELLIVIVVIAVLSGVILGVLNTGGIRQKARDSQRVSDLKKIQSALELYFADMRAYPTGSGWTNASTSLSTLAPNYISTLPTDPAPAGSSSTPCNGTTYRYFYISNGTGSAYYMAANMEVATDAAPSSCVAASGSGSRYPNFSCAGTPAANCYVVVSPAGTL